MMKIRDEFQLLLLEEGFLKKTVSQLKDHPLFTAEDLQKLINVVSIEEIEKTINKGDQLVGCCRRARGGGAGQYQKGCRAIW